MALSITATKWRETLTIRRPGGSSSARKRTLHPDPIRIVGVNLQPSDSRYGRDTASKTPLRGVAPRCPLAYSWLRARNAWYTFLYDFRSRWVGAPSWTRTPVRSLDPSTTTMA